jgi:endonuclease/exonuclease/phosphatase family metal-dependent hydrolase
MRKALLLLTLALMSIELMAQDFSELHYGTDRSLEILSWNIQFFPLNGDLTVDHLSELIPAIEADIIAFQEVAEVDVFNDMMSELPEYDYFVSSTDDWVKLAYVYNTNTVDVSNIYEIFSEEEYGLAFPRRPLVMEMNFDGEDYFIINNHFKALGDGILDLLDPEDEENRRLQATNLLKEYIDTNFPDDNVIVLGDLNDLITDDTENNVFQPLLEDPENYAFADRALATGNAENWSYPSWPSHLDHIVISNEIFDQFYAHSSSVSTLKIEDHLVGDWGEYSANISDHRPVALKLFKDESLVFNKDFEDQSLSSGAWTAYSIQGTNTWYVPEIPFGNNNSYCAAMSGYDNGAQEHESWYVSPQFSPDDYDDLRFSFWNTSGFEGPALEVYWSTDYSGDPQEASWTSIENVNWHDGMTNWDWTFSGFLDLSFLSGGSAHIAFRYNSTSNEAATWELDDIVLSDAPNVIDLSTSAIPMAGGMTAGDGAFIYGDRVEVSALAAENYEFVNWTNNEVEVSTENPYSFFATEIIELSANFQIQTSVEEHSHDREAIVYPNPTQGSLTLQFAQKDESELAELRLFDQLGTQIQLTQSVFESETVRLDLSSLPAGLYFLKVNFRAGEQESFKVLKIK